MLLLLRYLSGLARTNIVDGKVVIKTAKRDSNIVAVVTLEEE
jgi:hypothetical protein